PIPPMLKPNELTLRKNRLRNCAPTGLTPAGGAVWHPGGAVAPALTSQKISAAAGGDAKSLLLIVHFVPPWQGWQPARKNGRRPFCTSLGFTPPVGLPPPAVSSVVVNSPFGERMPKRTHSFSASRAGQAVVLSGSVMLSCGRPALGFRKAFRT